MSAKSESRSICTYVRQKSSQIKKKSISYHYSEPKKVPYSKYKRIHYAIPSMDPVPLWT